MQVFTITRQICYRLHTFIEMQPIKVEMIQDKLYSITKYQTYSHCNSGNYIYVYSSRRQNTALNRDKKTDRQTDRHTNITADTST